MRLVFLCSLWLAFVLVGPAEGGEPDHASGTPTVKDLSAQDLVLLSLSDTPTERRFAAQALQHAGSATLLAYFEALRTRMGLVERVPPISSLAAMRRRLREARQPAQPAPPTLHTETWIVNLSPRRRAALLRQVGVTLEGDAAILDEGGAAAFRDAVKADARFELKCAPRLSMRNGESASLTFEEQRGYVRAFRVVQAHGASVADPQIDTLSRGVVLRLQGRRAAASDRVTMDVRATWCDAPAPMPAYARCLGPGARRLKVQVPAPRLTLLQTSVDVPNGKYALLAGPRRPGGEASLLLLHVLSRPGPAPAPLAVKPPAQAPLVTLEARVLEVDAAAVARLLGETRATAKRQVVALDAAAAQALLAHLAAEKQARVVSAPRITAYGGQRANVSILKQTAYVQDYEVEQRTGEQVATPIVGTLNEGVVLDLTAHVAAGGGTLDLDLVARQAVVPRPIPEVQAEVAGTKVRIQTPDVQVRRLVAHATLPDGGWILVGDGTVFTPEKGRRVERFVLLRAAVVVPEEAAALRSAPPKKR